MISVITTMRDFKSGFTDHNPSLAEVVEVGFSITPSDCLETQVHFEVNDDLISCSHTLDLERVVCYDEQEIFNIICVGILIDLETQLQKVSTIH